MEEVEDEFWIEYRAKPKSEGHILLDTLDENVSIPKEAEQPERNAFNTENSWAQIPTDENLEYHETSIPLPPPPKELKPIRMNKKRFYPAGESSVGVSVLSVKGWVGHLDNSKTDLRLDSCADVTLISEEYYDSLRAKPSIQQGIRMKLWQLTDKNSSLRGFV